MARRTQYGRSLLVTALIGAVIGCAASLRSATKAQLLRDDGGRGSSSSTCLGLNCGMPAAESSKSSEKGKTGTGTSEKSSSSKSFFGDSGGTISGAGGGGSNEDKRREEEARKKAEEARKRAEEDRKRMEEDWKRMEGERLRIEQEALERLRKEEEERQRKLEEARNNALPPAGSTDAQPGCFSISGEWTTDRALCMQPKPPQEVKSRHPEEERIQEAKEDELQKKMEERYVATAKVEGKRMALLSLIQETSDRLSAVQGMELVTDPEQRQFIGSSIEWLKGGASYFTESRSEDEVDQMITYIRQIAEYAQDVVAEARKAAGASMAPDISALFLRTERLLLAFPDILALLSKEGITVDPNIASDYATLLVYFQTVRTACTQNAGSCSALDDVLTDMQHLQSSVQSVITVAGKPETEKLIREIVEARTK